MDGPIENQRVLLFIKLRGFLIAGSNLMHFFELLLCS
jgi:hypothetical protein